MTALDSAENRKKLGKESNGERRPGTTKMTIGTRKKGKLSLSLLVPFLPFFSLDNITFTRRENRRTEERGSAISFRSDKGTRRLSKSEMASANLISETSRMNVFEYILSTGWRMRRWKSSFFRDKSGKSGEGYIFLRNGQNDPFI